MHLTHARLYELSKQMDDALVSAVIGAPLYCTTRVDNPTIPEGATHVRTTPRGKKIEETQGPVVHGRNFLGIDPDTGEVVCTKCKGA